MPPLSSPLSSLALAAPHANVRFDKTVRRSSDELVGRTTTAHVDNGECNGASTALPPCLAVLVVVTAAAVAATSACKRSRQPDALNDRSDKTRRRDETKNTAQKNPAASCLVVAVVLVASKRSATIASLRTSNAPRRRQ